MEILSLLYHSRIQEVVILVFLVIKREVVVLICQKKLLYQIYTTDSYFHRHAQLIPEVPS